MPKTKFRRTYGTHCMYEVPLHSQKYLLVFELGSCPISKFNQATMYRVSHKSVYTLFLAFFSDKTHSKCKSWGCFRKFRKLLKYCGTTIPYPMWNHLTKLYYKVEKFTKKCGTIISIHTKYYGKPSGTIAVPLVNVEPSSPYSSHMWNHFPNSYLIQWLTKWNQSGSTCGANVVPHVEPFSLPRKWYYTIQPLSIV